jgi:hypothetical protein
VAAVVLRAEQLSGGQADAQGDLGGHRMLVGLAADAVGAEIGALAHGLHYISIGSRSDRETIRNADL